MKNNLLLTAVLLMSSAMPAFANGSISASQIRPVSPTQPVCISGPVVCGLNVIAINAGGATVGNFLADRDLTSGRTYTTVHDKAVDTSGISNPPPQAVYHTLRYGKDFTYTIPNLAPNASYNVIFDLDEPYWDQPNQRKFSVAINGKEVITDLDIFAVTKKQYKALSPSFDAVASASGQIVLHFTASINEALIAGIEIRGSTTGGSGSGNMETPKQADAFVDSIGMDTHFDYYGSPYDTNWGKLEPLLIDLGIRHIRDGGHNQRAIYYSRLNTLGQAGIHNSGGADHYYVDSAGKAHGLTDADIVGLMQEMPYMEYIEPDNEYDGSKDPNWASVLQAWQKHLYTLVKSTPSMAKITVLAPPLINTTDASKLGNLSAYMDAGNVHNGPACGTNPGANAKYLGVLKEEQADSGSKPIWISETGYSDDPLRPCHQPSAILAKYLPRDFLEWELAGATRVYEYQFSNMIANDAIFGGTGIVDDSGNPKPQYYALKSMISLLTDKGAAFTPQPISLTFGGDMNNVHHMTFQKRDGSYWIAFWIETLGYNYVQATHGGTPINVSPQAVTITAGMAISSATAYTYDTSDWSLKASAVKIGAGNLVSLNATDTVTFLKIK